MEYLPRNQAFLQVGAFQAVQHHGLDLGKVQGQPDELEGVGHPFQRFQRGAVDIIDRGADQHDMAHLRMAPHLGVDEILHVSRIGEGEALVYPYEYQFRPGFHVVAYAAKVARPRYSPDYCDMRSSDTPHVSQQGDGDTQPQPRLQVEQDDAGEGGGMAQCVAPVVTPCGKERLQPEQGPD